MVFRSCPTISMSFIPAVSGTEKFQLVTEAEGQSSAGSSEQPGHAVPCLVSTTTPSSANRPDGINPPAQMITASFCNA